MRPGPYPQGAFTATKAQRAAMHAADAAMRIDNLARHVIDAHPETHAGREARKGFLTSIEERHGKATRKAVEKAAREYWRATRKSRAPGSAS